ncbi:helix-turn-helix domain-containing protein [Nocardia fluminea]|uniref:AraC family transcriptional regulator n=1 Tax=Nocardia fluminea TaxID=134984 RepID=UPI0033E501DB
MARMIRVRRGTDAGVHWAVAETRPPAPLADLVAGYRSFREFSPAPVVRREPPRSGLVLVLNRDTPISLTREHPARTGSAPAGALVGIGQLSVEAAHDGSQDVLEVRLSPLAALRIFGITGNEVADRVIDLVDLWGKYGRALLEQFAAADSSQERFDVLDSALISGAERGRELDPVLVGAWQAVLTRGGALTMRELQDQTGWSRRRLAERFRAQVGLTPKAAARLVRYEHAAQLLRRPGTRSIASIALTCGYFDQAHLNRDFRDFTGCTPSSFRTALRTDPAGAAMACD